MYCTNGLYSSKLISMILDGLRPFGYYLGLTGILWYLGMGFLLAFFWTLYKGKFNLLLVVFQILAWPIIMLALIVYIYFTRRK